ncbi:MAG: heparinase II/III family protein [Planctomycetota bacterium]|nr:heparinase II/III family protein [Planctomycetota bacterium]
MNRDIWKNTPFEEVVGWRDPNRVLLDYPSEDEIHFRDAVEGWKASVQGRRSDFEGPVLWPANIEERVKANMTSRPRLAGVMESILEEAEPFADRPKGFFESFVPRRTPWTTMGFTCPNCVGRLSFEANSYVKTWDWQNPDVFHCARCGEEFPNLDKYPESVTLNLPRMKEEFEFYIRPEEEESGYDFRSGERAWHWARQPIAMSYSGIVREHQVLFALRLVSVMSQAYALSRDARYAVRVKWLLSELAPAFRRYVYRTQVHEIVDADPLYAAFCSGDFPLPMKRCLYRPCYSETEQRGGPNARVTGLWGGGRFWAGDAQCCSHQMIEVIRAYDLLYDVKDENGSPLLEDSLKETIERDFLMEFVLQVIQFSPYTNKSWQVTAVVAAAGRALDIPEWIHWGLEGSKGHSALAYHYDGGPRETPMYCASHESVRHVLDLEPFFKDYTDPDSYGEDDYRQLESLRRNLNNEGQLISLGQPYRNLRLADEAWFRGLLGGYDLLVWPDFTWPTMGDGEPKGMATPGMVSHARALLGKSSHSLRHQPSTGAGLDLFRDSPAQTEDGAERDLPSVTFPDWGATFLRFNGGLGEGAQIVALNALRGGGHRHHDSLNLMLWANGKELAHDLGYLCDLPQNRWIASAYAHNRVVIDESHTDDREKGGDISLYHESPLFQAVEASSRPCEAAEAYRRTIVAIPVDGSICVVDVFHARGGSTHDYVFHAQDDCQEGETMNYQPHVDWGKDETSLAEDLSNGFFSADHECAPAPAVPAEVTWDCQGPSLRLTRLSKAKTVHRFTGLGGRERNEFDRRIKVFVERRNGKNLSSTFVHVIEPGSPFPTQSSKLIYQGENGEAMVEVTTENSSFVVWVAPDAQPRETGHGVFAARLAVIAHHHDGRVQAEMVGGRKLSFRGLTLGSPSAFIEGRILEWDSSGFTTDVDLSPLSKTVSSVQVHQELIPAASILDENGQPALDPGGLAVQGEPSWGSYQIDKIEGNRINVRLLPFAGGSKFRIENVVKCEEQQ